MRKINSSILYDVFLRVITYLSASIFIIILAAILINIFSNGTKLLSFKLLTSDYHYTPYRLSTSVFKATSFNDPNIKDAYFSKEFGFSVIDGYTLEGEETIKFVYIDKNSPLNNMVNDQGENVAIEKGFIFDSTMTAINSDLSTTTIFSKNGASNLVTKLEGAIGIKDANVRNEGGGIRGSIITTLYLIVLTLLFGLPFGIFTALYLHEIAPQNKLTQTLRSFIDMLTGIPSIIFGLMGAAVFIPLTSKLFNNPDMNRGSLLAGSLTLTIIILPVIIKATESALNVVPKSYKEASFSLGATKTQTTFRVMLPNALPGILSGAILSVGRIIGESAALIFAMGTFIGDKVSITGRSTSLAVHIWSVMGGEIPNVELASTISIIILFIVLVLNILVKIITHRFLKKYN